MGGVPLFLTDRRKYPMLLSPAGYEITIAPWNPSVPPWRPSAWLFGYNAWQTVGDYWSREAWIGPWHIVVSKLRCALT